MIEGVEEFTTELKFVTLEERNVLDRSKVNPLYKDALLSSGEVYVSLNQPSEALSPLRRAISLDADDAGAHLILGTALIKLGHTAEGAKERELCGRIRARQRVQPSK